MKKLVFTALAVSVFSGVSMAKTTEVNVVSIAETAEVVVFKDCNKEATDNTNRDESARDINGYGCYTSTQYNKIRKLYYIECKLTLEKVEELTPFLDEEVPTLDDRVFELEP